MSNATGCVSGQFINHCKAKREINGGWYSYLEAVKVYRLEVIGGTSAPVNDVLVLAFTAQFTIPVGDAQVVIHHALTVGTVLQHSVEE